MVCHSGFDRGGTVCLPGGLCLRERLRVLGKGLRGLVFLPVKARTADFSRFVLSSGCVLLSWPRHSVPITQKSAGRDFGGAGGGQDSLFQSQPDASQLVQVCIFLLIWDPFVCCAVGSAVAFNFGP